VKNLIESNIAIVGAGKFCKTFLQFLYSEEISDRKPKILGVADIDGQAPGLQYAKKMGIFTTNDYGEFYRFKDLQVILELTRDNELAQIIKKSKPPDVILIDHFGSRYLWDSLQIEDVKIKALKELRCLKSDPEAVESLFEQITERFSKIIRQRNLRSRKIEMELVGQQRTLSQIIQGSTIPTFVINKSHIITHWNKAMERLSNILAEDVVGTNRQWEPFYGQKRPTMADLILEKSEEDEIKKFYGTKWRKSALIEGAFEAEGFFPKLGEDGKWCWFTAAPIKGSDGTIDGAIETLWDRTEDKKAEEQRERHTQELAALCLIYSALNAPLSLDDRINAVIQEIKDFLSADSICIFLGKNETFHIKYHLGPSDSLPREQGTENSVIRHAAKNDSLMIFDDLSEGRMFKDIDLFRQEGLRSMAYIPISAKEKGIGVIRIGSKMFHQFSSEEKRVLELIGNRIGVAIENAMLQEQYIKSEEKYRSLFNNDPNPIFIIDSHSFEILDTNQRAQDCYGYSRKELFGVSFLDLGDENDAEIPRGLKKLSQRQSVLFSKKRHYKKDGEPFYVNINVSFAKYSERDVLIATTTDITENVEKETQLIQAGKMTTLGVMAAGMAHEINQPLNVIQICADFFLKMLKKGVPIGDEDMRNMANDIIANVERATGVIRHVREFARQSEVVKNKVNINDPIKDVFKVLGHQLKVHQIEVELNLEPDIPLIMAEHNRLEQVFINLVTNAIDAMDEKISDQGVPEKRLQIESFEENGQVVVNVSDTGTGMSEVVKNKIFEPFFTTKRVGKGTGLGVSISYGIVKDYDGAIEIKSQMGKGTTFILKFPALT
jgi:PAS domain S-box-containing protein